jgi:hypothetical protein
MPPGGLEFDCMDRPLAIVATLLVGGLVAFQPPANALLSREVSVRSGPGALWPGSSRGSW